jgi:GDP-L-fucose synthase
MPTTDAVFVAGSDTLIGSAIVRALAIEGRHPLVGLGPDQPDLRDGRSVEAFLSTARPAQVYVAAGRAAGIAGNQKYPADLMVDNLLVVSSVIPAAWRNGTRKLLYLASSCTYPRLAPQPMHPSSLLTGPIEPTNEPYAVAKLAGIKLCLALRRQHGADFVAGIPADVFGPGDDFTPEDSHVVSGLMRRMHEAAARDDDHLTVWGSGNQRREFLYVDDLARACLFAMDHYSGEAPLNLGGGRDTSIRELAEHIRDVVGFRGELLFDASKPDGMPLKALDASVLLGLGWAPIVPFRDALERTYQSFREVDARPSRH